MSSTKIFAEEFLVNLGKLNPDDTGYHAEVSAKLSISARAFVFCRIPTCLSNDVELNTIAKVTSEPDWQKSDQFEPRSRVGSHVRFGSGHSSVLTSERSGCNRSVGEPVN